MSPDTELRGSSHRIYGNLSCSGDPSEIQVHVQGESANPAGSIHGCGLLYELETATPMSCDSEQLPSSMAPKEEPGILSPTTALLSTLNRGQPPVPSRLPPMFSGSAFLISYSQF